MPISGGSASTSLSVRMSQRSACGSDLPDTVRIWFALKPTMLNCLHRPRTSGNSVNRLSEQKRMRSLCRRGKSSGSDESALPERSRISSVSARSKISRGNSLSPQANFRRCVPANCPASSWSRVVVTVLRRAWRVPAGWFRKARFYRHVASPQAHRDPSGDCKRTPTTNCALASMAFALVASGASWDSVTAPTIVDTIASATR